MKNYLCFVSYNSVASVSKVINIFEFLVICDGGKLQFLHKKFGTLDLNARYLNQ